MSETSRVIIDRGTIIRNATDGYVIMNGQITRIGDDGDLSMIIMKYQRVKEIFQKSPLNL